MDWMRSRMIVVFPDPYMREIIVPKKPVNTVIGVGISYGIKFQ
jgi:hypothetical protein